MSGAVEAGEGVVGVDETDYECWDLSATEGGDQLATNEGKELNAEGTLPRTRRKAEWKMRPMADKGNIDR